MNMQVKRFFLVIILLLSFVSLSFAQEPRPIVRIIYLVPNDRDPQPDIDAKIDQMMKEVQQFYADQMELHGFGRKTFLFETDVQGNAVVHHRKSRFNDEYFLDTTDALAEITTHFDQANRIFVCFLDVGHGNIPFGTGSVCGLGGGDGRRGSMIIPATGDCFSSVIMAHELGHVFGLQHDYRSAGEGNWKYTSHTLSDRMPTSFLAAEWMDVIPAFNTNPRPANYNTTIKMLTPILVSRPNTFRFRFKVEDPDGLQQVQLHTYDQAFSFYSGKFSNLRDYKSLEGSRSSTVEFVTDAVELDHKSVSLRSIDVHGNKEHKDFPINLPTLLSPPEIVSVPDPHLAAAIQEEIAGSITTHSILNLATLDVRNRGITDLTGLEHALSLRTLHLGGNAVSDMSPLAGAIQLTNLYLDGSGISDVETLAGLTQLKNLNLNNNSISDLKPLTGLTQLRILYLDNNGISDLKPLAGMTKMIHLELKNNSISDLKPLTGLTQLQILYLDNNSIPDLKPLAGLTKMQVLNLNNNNISDLKPLAGLTRMQNLNLNTNGISDLKPLAGMTQLRVLYLDNNSISDLKPLAGMTKMIHLELKNNSISDLKPLAGLTKLAYLFLRNNSISNLEPLTGLTQLKHINVYSNPLSYDSINTHIPALQAKGIEIVFSNVAHPTILKVSGDAQEDVVGKTLSDPFIVTVQDERGQAMHGVTVTFTINEGEGELNPTTTTTDVNGNAQTTFTLGSTPGTSIIRATATGLKTYVRFTATALPDRPVPPSIATVSLMPQIVESPAIGEQLTFSLKIADGESISGYQAIVNFDATALRYVSGANGDYLPSGAFFIPPKTQGNSVTLAATSLAGEINGNGTLATITFEVVAVKASTVRLSDVILTNSMGETTQPQTENAEITEPTQLPEDVNDDGVVNIVDLTLVATNFGATGSNAADVNDDGVVNIVDLTLVAAAFGNTAAAPFTGSLDSEIAPTRADVEAWLNESRQLNLSDPNFQRGIVVLESLLKALTPKMTALLPNYPNPFNPETWIPYQLAKPADVSISIYASDGKLIRKLDLGHQPIGKYHHRSHAAHWDGKNVQGEPVASGVYFYTITAGEFSATRKMLIRK